MMLSDLVALAATTRRDGLAREVARVARDPEGRPSDAVRAYLLAHPADAGSRGALLRDARRLLEQAPGQAHVPATPSRVLARNPAHHGYPVELRDPASDRFPLLAMEAFSGGGLFSLASAIEGNIEVADCEWNKAAVATRHRNRESLRLAFDPVRADARTWRPSTRTPGGLDLLFGGPPCSPFSKGAEMGRSDRDRGWRAADNFFPLALDWMVDLQPRAVAWENAPTLLEKPEYRQWLETWQAEARIAGYDSEAHVLDAADFGNPTMRRRTFVLAWPTGAAWGHALARRPGGHFARPGSPEVRAGQKLPWLPMVDRLTSGCCAGWGLVDCVHLGAYGTAEGSSCRGCGNGRNFSPAPNTGGDHGRRGVKGVQIDTARGLVPWHTWIRETVGPVQPRFDKFTPADAVGAWTPLAAPARDLVLAAGRRVSEYLSRTVVPGFENKAEGLMIPPGIESEPYRANRTWGQADLEELQRMSVRDAAKLQDVPQWYGFEGSRIEAFSQVGMGVPVNLGRGVMAHVRAALGLPLRAPWWETRVPVRPRAVPFESRAEITATPREQRALRKGEGTGWPDGLWPMDAFDACYAVPPPLQHGLVLAEHEIDDWEAMLHHGEVGAEAERAEGRSKGDRGARVLPGEVVAQGRRRAGRQVQALFTPDGLARDALWEAGYRGPPDVPPDAMPWSEEIDATEEWADALRYSDGGPWATVLGLYLRLAYPETMYGRGEEYPWRELFDLEADLPTIDAGTAAVFAEAGLPAPTPALLQRARVRDRAAR